MYILNAMRTKCFRTYTVQTFYFNLYTNGVVYTTIYNRGTYKLLGCPVKVFSLSVKSNCVCVRMGIGLERWVVYVCGIYMYMQHNSKQSFKHII